MPAYLIVMRNEPIRDADAMAEYQRKTRETRPTVAPAPLVVYGAMQALEGEAPDGMVMLQFDTVEDARGWYESPGYQAALPHRLKAADHRAFIVQGL
ncbi:MAG TPA: DUF1330 domain-containing protein [Sphingobium sp.]|uniref:DUF1330 domain-containing protein n=1 Tax=Sphingobium sp. TaxID=1912891 RepID=UPI002ED1AC72